MKELRARVTSKGQVTIPLEVRRLLGLSVPDNVAFIVDDGEVRIKKKGSVVQETAGSVPYDGPPLTALRLREDAEEAIADDVMERMAP